MKNSLAKVLCTSLLILFSSCGSDGDDKDTASNKVTILGQQAVLTGESDLKIEDGKISGTGGIIYENPLAKEVKSGKNIYLDFSLEDGGQLVLATYAKNILTGGYTIRLKRSAKVLKVDVLQKDGKTYLDISKSFQSIDASKAISLSFDIHNDEDPAAHVLIWKNNDKTEETALFNSEKSLTDDQGKLFGKGSDVYWGFSLSKATITKATVREPLFEDAE